MSIHDAKFDYLFTCFDRRKNGKLDVSDFLAFGRALRDASGWEQTDPRSRRIARALDAFWEVMIVHIDADGSGDVDRQEFTTFENIMSDQTKSFAGTAPTWALELYRAIFEALDKNADGKLELSEYATYLAAIDSNMDPAAAFAKLDLDGSGFIELSELDVLLVSYFTSTNATDPGNYLLTGGWPT
jgi:Ca2+-binding EF-hand superfamily protein